MSENTSDHSQSSAPEKNSGDGGKKKRSRAVRIARAVGWTLAGLLVFILLLLIFRDFVITRAITGVGGWLTGTKITLEKFETSLSEGDVRITNLRISNPDGYARPNLLELDSFYIRWCRRRLFSVHLW